MSSSSTNEPLLELLRHMELSEKESQVYLSALALGNALVKDIAKQAHLNRTTTYNILLILRKLGLVSSYQKQGLVHFSAVTPQRLQDLLDKRINRQQELKQQLQHVMPMFNALFHSQAHGSHVQLFEGLDSLSRVYWPLFENMDPHDESLEFTNWGGKHHLFPKTFREDVFAYMKKRNIVTRSLLVEDDLTHSWVKQGIGKNMQKNIRLIPNPGWDFFANIEMCQNKIAIVTYRDDVDFQGIIIENREMAAMFKLLFETLWDKYR